MAKSKTKGNSSVNYKINYSPTERVQLINTEKSRTHQSFENETNINSIMAKYEKTGLISHFNKHKGKYGNFIDAVDYHTAQNRIIEAQDAFYSLPSKVRAKFENAPEKFLEFAQNPDNLEEMVNLGLAKRSEIAELAELASPAQGSANSAAEENESTEE